MFKFKPEDFFRYPGSFAAWGEEAAKMANRALETYLATLPRVYGYMFGKCKDIDWRTTDYSNITNETEHIVQKEAFTPSCTALLWGITEIEKKECEHEINPAKYYYLEDGKTLVNKCDICGVKLKAKWEKA